MNDTQPNNEEIAGLLQQIADLLEAQDANTFRVRAYERGARTVQASERPVAAIVRQEGGEGLRDLPDIGEGLANVIEEYVNSGRSSLLDELRGETSPEDVIRQTPGIGEELAKRVVSELGVHTLEELEQAAHDGRLAEVEGFGEARVRAVRVALAGLLSGAAQRRIRHQGEPERSEDRPSVATLLDVDAEYRRKGQAGELRRIAPKRFNPEGEAWLPILNTEREGRAFTALFSNTATAHEAGKTDDWVVIYYEVGSDEDQVTVVTETGGALDGRRVVRGLEAETRRYYEQQD